MRKFLAFCMLAAGAVGMQQSPVAAAPEDFDCRGSGLRVNSPILNSEPIRSNAANAPCQDDVDQLASVAVPGVVSSGVVVTNTDSTATSGHADATVNNTLVTAGGAVIRATVVSSQADATCVAGQASLTGSSRVAGLTINGTPINVLDQPVTIPANPLVVVAINERTVSGGQITQRAIHIRSVLLGFDIVIAESQATTKSCAPPVGECNDGINNDPDEDIKVDANDPGCHTDLDRTNPDSYDPNIDQERSGPLQCGDGVDNDGDDLIDAADTGCHWDGDADNSETYDPSDNTETPGYQ